MVLFPFQNKYNFMIQNLSYKECNFDLPTTKDKSFRKLLIQKTRQCLDFSYKRQETICNFHLTLVYIFNFKIVFILEQRKYIEYRQSYQLRRYVTLEIDGVHTDSARCGDAALRSLCLCGTTHERPDNLCLYWG